MDGRLYTALNAIVADLPPVVPDLPSQIAFERE
jgi:hypothetical protein